MNSTNATIQAAALQALSLTAWLGDTPDEQAIDSAEQHSIDIAALPSRLWIAAESSPAWPVKSSTPDGILTLCDGRRFETSTFPYSFEDTPGRLTLVVSRDLSASLNIGDPVIAVVIGRELV